MTVPTPPTPPTPPTDDIDSDAMPHLPSSVVTVAPDDPLAGLEGGLAPLVPDLVRDMRRSKARRALFGKPAVRRFGRYIVLDELGRGGMGTVLTAYDPQLDRKVALKLLHEPHAEAHARRLEREAKALAKLSHPNVVQVYEVGVQDEQHFVAMELVEGQTLQQWQAERHPWRACVDVYLQAGRGLAAAHAKGLVHRDFKPGNCILDAEGRVRVLDFGLVSGSENSVLDAATQQALTGSLDPDRYRRAQTITGTVLGTPAYMPPEQFEGQPADDRSDQFSFCVSLFEAVYGERPFANDSTSALRSSTLDDPIRPSPAGTRVPPRLRRVLARGLAASPDDRWPSMEALLEQLRRQVTPRARRWALLSLAVGVLGVGGGLSLGRAVEQLEHCADAHRRLTNIWDDGRRQEVEAAVLGTGLSYAPSTWERVEQRLDDYADAWASKHTEVCEASTADEQGEQDRRLRLDCMHERSRALRAAVGVLARADARVVEKAVELATGLPGFDRCDDLEALRAAVPPPEDPAVRREVEALRERLADFAAATDAGKYRSSREEAERVVQQAQALGYEPLVAEAKQHRGRSRAANGQYDEAEQDLQEAHEVAMEHRHDEVALHTAQQLALVVGVRQQRHAEGSVWGRVAVTHAKRSQQPIEIAKSLDRFASILVGRGEYETARRHYEHALQMLETALGPDHLELATIRNNLGRVLWLQGEYEHALSHHERALRIREQAMGANHPVVAQSLMNMAVVFRAQGRYEPAMFHHQRALQIFEKALGADHPEVATCLDNLGVVFMNQGKYEQAQDHYERALRIHERSLGVDHPLVASTLSDLGGALEMQGEYEQSRLHHERALRIREQALGADHPDVAYSLHNLGNVLDSEGDLEQAVRHYERALAIWEKTLGVAHPNVATTLTSLGHALEGQQEYARARGHYERALAISQEALGSDHPLVATILNNLGVVVMAEGAYEQARGYSERALRLDEETLGTDHPNVAHPLSQLAKVGLAQEDFEGARAHAERALSIRENNLVAPELLAMTRFVLAQALWSDQAQRARARALAEQARDAFLEAGDAHEDDRAEVEQWLAEHRVR